MKTPHRATPSRRSVRVLTLLAMVAAMGCTNRSKSLRPGKPGPHTVTLTFNEKGCPIHLNVEESKRCDVSDDPKADLTKCLLSKKGAEVNYLVANLPDVPAEVEFSLAFDTNPFDPVKDNGRVKKGEKQQRHLKPDLKDKTTYTYQVTSPGCTPVDPQIIIRD